MTRSSRLDTPSRRSLRHSLRDAAAFSVMVGGGESYLSAFALLLKASAAQIALLVALPPLIGSWAQLLAAWLSRGHGRRRPFLVAGAVMQALMLALAATAPLVASGPVAALIICVVAYHVAGNFTQPLWASLMNQLVPEGRRGRFFARRNRIVSLTTFAALVVAGALLEVLDRKHSALAGFVIVFTAAVAARLVSAWHLHCMHDPDHDGPPSTSPATTVRRWIADLRDTPFVRFSGAIAAMQGAVAIAGPFFAVLMLRDLGFSYLQFMAVTATSVLGHFVTLTAWGRIGDRFGNRVILVTAGWLLPLIPALWLVSVEFWWVLGVQLLSGLAWGGFNLSAGNYLFDLRPGRGVSGYMALHAVVVAAAVFAGATLGAHLATRLPVIIEIGGHALEWKYQLLGVVAVSAIARAAVAVLLLRRVREVRRVAPASFYDVAFRMARFNAVSVMVMDVVSAVRRRNPRRVRPPLGHTQTGRHPPGAT